MLTYRKIRKIQSTLCLKHKIPMTGLVVLNVFYKCQQNNYLYTVSNDKLLLLDNTIIIISVITLQQKCFTVLYLYITMNSLFSSESKVELDYVE